MKFLILFMLLCSFQSKAFLSREANGGAVDSVNGRTGDVVVDAADVGLGNVADKDLGNADNTADLDKSNGLAITTPGAAPTCNSGARGTIWIVRGGAGVADIIEYCKKKSDDSYAWSVFTSSP